MIEDFWKVDFILPIQQNDFIIFQLLLIDFP